MGVKCFQSKSWHILPAFPLYTGTDILRAKWSKLERRLYSVLDTHKDFLTHGYSGRHTEKERDLEARYRHKETERPALTQEETCTQVTCTHLEYERQRLLQKGRQTEI